MQIMAVLISLKQQPIMTIILMLRMSLRILSLDGLYVPQLYSIFSDYLCRYTDPFIAYLFSMQSRYENDKNKQSL